jgi:hypothetical protein
MAERIRSILQLTNNKEITQEINHFSELIENHFNHIKNKLELRSKGQMQEEIGKAILQRSYVGPLSYKQLSKPDRREYKKIKFELIAKKYWGGIILELLNLADGKRPLEDIFLLLKAYYPEVTYGDIIFIVKLFMEENILVEIETSILSEIEYPFRY